VTEKQTKKALELMRHALRLNDKPISYRNYFVTSKQSTDYPIIELSLKAGYMTEGRKLGFLPESDSYYYVTEAGKQFVDQHISAPEKLTRSQRRYRTYLSADSGECFGDWLKNKYWDNYRRQACC
jgi:hypothetical protein